MVHRTSEAVNALDRPNVVRGWFHDTVAARLVVGLSPLRVRWNGTRFHAHSARLRNDLYCVGWGVKLYSLTPCSLRDPARSTDGFRSPLKTHLFCGAKGTISAFEALRDALYKSTTTTTTTTTDNPCNSLYP